MVKILIIDDNKSLGDQIRKIAETSGLNSCEIHAAYLRAKRLSPTEASNERSLYIDIIPEDYIEPEYIPEKKVSYEAKQKSFLIL